MKKITMILATGLLAYALVGCSGKQASPAQASASPAAHAHSEGDGHDHSAQATPSGGKVKVAADGTKFDPPVSKDKIPDEAWACVMGGKVHYASTDKGTGKCPVCKMKLNQHAAHSDQ